MMTQAQITMIDQVVLLAAALLAGLWLSPYVWGLK